jgi:hypothetical protein
MSGMKRLFYILLFFLILQGILWSDNQNYYDSWGDIFSGLEDPNTGLTVFPTLLIPMGGRYEGMGTAFTGVSDDSGFIESNPAGSSVLENGELAFLHHSWIADSNMEGVIWSIRLGNLGFGAFSKFLYVPFTEYNDWGERDSSGLISETIAGINISYNFFSNYKFHGLALGTNVKFAYRHIPKSIYEGQSAATAMIDIGLLTRFNFLKPYNSSKENFSIGAAFKNFGFPAKGEPLPTMFSTGIAYSPARPLLLAVDFNLPISFNNDEQPAERWYIATGFDVTVTDFLGIHGGFQIKENPRLSLGAAVNLTKVSFVLNYNLDLSGKLNPLDKFSIAARINLGDRGRAALLEQIQTLYADGLEAYASGDWFLAIDLWQQVIELDPKFLPAIEILATTLERLELQDEIRERQQLNS